MLLLVCHSDTKTIRTVKLGNGDAHGLADMAYGGNTGDRGTAEKISYAVWGNIHFLCKAVMAPASDPAELFDAVQLKTHCSHTKRGIPVVIWFMPSSASCGAVIFVFCIIVSHCYKKDQAEIECIDYTRKSEYQVQNK